MIDFKSHYTKRNPYLAPLSGQESTTSQVTDARREHTTIILTDKNKIDD